MAVANVSAEAPMKDIVDTAVAAGSFNTLVAAVKAAGLVDTLKSPGPFTVFAPTDEAFEKLPKGTLESLLKPENKEKLIAILTLHVVPGRLSSGDVVSLVKIPTVGETDLLVSNTSAGPKVDSANIIKTNIATSNGVIHVIDTVLLPKDIVDTAKIAGQFKTLLAAAQAAGLVDALKNPKAKLTLFAPTDEAFSALPAGTVYDLLLPSNRARLANILKFHVLDKPILLLKQSPKTLMGLPLMVSSAGPAKVNDANIILADIKTTNGVIQVIDKVLLPKMPEATPAQKAINVIELAIERGVPLFNSHKVESCAAIYEVTVESLLAGHDKALSSDDRQRLQKARTDAKKDDNARKKAWTLRYALDDVLKSLKNRK